ncbi:WbuC family cupin fold metalloprotein [Polynucleobacter paneuropaeus]|nr:WbuC family cupin fold metalloprotein [Polynucleobacter paneuropaeus]
MAIVKISAQLIDGLNQRVKLFPRLRLHHNFHADYSDAVQLLVNAVDVNSYIRPHRHLMDPKSECLIALKGSFALVSFDDGGTVEDVIKFGSESHIGDVENFGVNIPPGIWHTVIALTKNSVLFESKSGPFFPLRAKEFAFWAPPENSSEAIYFLENLRKHVNTI